MAVKSACNRLNTAEKPNYENAVQAEVNAYSLSEKNMNAKDSALFREYLMTACRPEGTGLNSFEMAYSDCAKGCPPPAKVKGNEKGKGK